MYKIDEEVNEKEVIGKFTVKQLEEIFKEYVGDKEALDEESLQLLLKEKLDQYIPKRQLTTLIKSIDIDTELRKMWFRGKEYRHYAERIIFHCDDGEHIFALKHSSENEPELTNSQFTRLKEFIEENVA